MADNSMMDAQPRRKASRAGKLLLIMFLLFFLVILAAGGFAAGVYFKIVDVQALSDKYKLYSYPVIGKYFVKPPDAAGEVAAELPPAALPQPPPVAQPLPMPPQPKISTEEAERQQKERKDEEQKRLKKLAALYGAMKPEEVVPIMDKLSDDEVLDIIGKMEDDQVARILPLFAPERAARLTQSIMRGRKPPVTPGNNASQGQIRVPALPNIPTN